MSHYSTRSLVTDGSFYAPATSRTTLFESTTGRQTALYMATRIRGYIVAPTTGDYRFWVSGRNGVELYLSDDASKYRKRRIAEINPELGDGHGIEFGDTNLWDQSAAQMSEPIPLVKGQKYYFETLEAQGHAGNAQVSLAWAPPGEGRARIPSACLHSYTQEAADADDDYLPDAWETQYGLDVLDNGRIDLARQGERGDFDSDGLANREEFLLGTDPANADTDGDSSSDSDEVNHYGTSPTLSNSIINTLVDSPLLTHYNAANTSGSWQIFDGGLLGSSFRGKIQWTFTVPADGWWMVDLAGRLRGTLRSVEDLPLGIMVDDKSLAEQNLRFLNGQPASLKVLTPFLQAGTHTFSVDVRNAMGRRTFQIQSLQVFGLGGFDGDSNGSPDWVDNMLTQANQLAPVATESAVSPLFIEGSTRHLGGASVSSSSTNVPVQRGLGDLHWFANVPLATEGSTPLSVSLENQSQSLGVTWTRWNAMAGQSLTIRVGDSVKIAGWLTTSTTGTVQIAVAGQTQTLSVDDYFVKTFTAPGTFPVTATHSSGSQTTVSITVVAADFGTPASFYEDTVTWRSFPNVPASLKISAETSLGVDATQAEGKWQKAQLRPFRGGNHVLAARIPNGSIVALGTVITMGISDALRNDATVYVGSTADGYRVLRTPIMLTNLTVGGRVVLTIFRAGVTFLDGLTVKTLTAGDFVDGVAYVDFRFPPNQTGGHCHYIDVYDAAGKSLGRH
jgi:PA14 domain